MTCWILRMDVFLSAILNLTGWRERLWAGFGVSGTSPPASRPRRKSTPPAPFWKILLASSVDPIAIVDEHGRFTRWNQAAAEAYGYSAEGLAGLTAFDLYADKPALDKMLGQLRRDGFVRGYEIDMRKKDGTIAPFSLSIGLFGG